MPVDLREFYNFSHGWGFINILNMTMRMNLYADRLMNILKLTMRMYVCINIDHMDGFMNI